MRVERVMGTAVRFATEGATAGVEAAIAWLHWVDDTFSVHRPDSQIMRIRRGAISANDIHPEVGAVLDRCTGLRVLTEGWFDHRPEGDLDPSGYVKGWAVERAASLLEQHGVSRFYVDAGGDIATRGTWTVGIRNPKHPARTLLAVELTDEAIATSGTYERGNHIWGRHPAGLASVSVIGPDLGTADAVSTALFSSGGEDPAWLERFPDYEVVAITHDLRVWQTPSAPILGRQTDAPADDRLGRPWTVGTAGDRG